MKIRHNRNRVKSSYLELLALYKHRSHTDSEKICHVLTLFFIWKHCNYSSISPQNSSSNFIHNPAGNPPGSEWEGMENIPQIRSRGQPKGSRCSPFGEGTDRDVSLSIVFGALVVSRAEFVLVLLNVMWKVAACTLSRGWAILELDLYGWSVWP